MSQLLPPLIYLCLFACHWFHRLLIVFNFGAVAAVVPMPHDRMTNCFICAPVVLVRCCRADATLRRSQHRRHGARLGVHCRAGELLRPWRRRAVCPERVHCWLLLHRCRGGARRVRLRRRNRVPGGLHSSGQLRHVCAWVLLCRHRVGGSAVRGWKVRRHGGPICERLYRGVHVRGGLLLSSCFYVRLRGALFCRIFLQRRGHCFSGVHLYARGASARAVARRFCLRALRVASVHASLCGYVLLYFVCLLLFTGVCARSCARSRACFMSGPPGCA